MPTRDNDTERNVRIEQDESARKNGRNGNGKHLMVDASAPRGDNSVEKSLEEFIARANSTFLDADGWDLTPEPEPEPPKPAPEPVVVVPARVAATTVSPADVAQAVAATDAVVEEETPIAPTDATHVVAREAISAPPIVVTKTSWGGIFVAFLLGGGMVFGGMKYLEEKQTVEKPTATEAAAAPAQAEPVKPKTSAAQAEEVTAVQPEGPGATGAEPGATQPGAQPTALQPGAPGETAAAPPQGAPVVQPLVQPLPEVKGGEPVALAPKGEPKAEPKKVTPKKSEPKKATAKGGIVDPFGEAEAPKKKEPPKKAPPKKKKDSAPKGGIVDPFAT